jgi:hypothetical protein
MNRIKSLESIITSLKGYEAELQKKIDLVRTYSAEQEVALQFVEQFPEDLAKDEWSSPRTQACISFDSGTVHGFMLNFNASTLDELVEPLKWLTQRLGAYTISDYPEIQRRSYTFLKGRFHFQVFFGDASSADHKVCKFVKVGVEEKPVYEMRCE